MSLCSQTAHQLHTQLKNRNITATQILSDVYDRIKQVEDQIGGYITLAEETAFETAGIIDQRLQNGDDLPKLSGIPVAIKDVICTKGIRTTCASKILANFIPPYDATVIEKLKKQGVIIVGKTNMDEFAMGSSTENSAYQLTRNPWNTSTTPGGSSGGSAAVVSADTAILSLGSDTGGSIRQPASFCGNVGLKPTYGRVSRFGLIAFASSLDQIGPFTKDVRDSALAMNAICGYDPMDSTSAKFDVPDFENSLINDIEGLKIGLPDEYFLDGISQEVETSVREAISQLEHLGATIHRISMPHTEYAIATYYIIAPAEASANLARYDGVRFGYRATETNNLESMYKLSRSQGFGPEVKRRILLGTYSLSSGYYDAYYLKAQKVRTLIKKDFDEAFETVDVIVTPTSPTAAFKFGARTNDPLQMYLSDIFTAPSSLAGIPGISVPCGITKDRLPIGLQFLAPPFDEETLLRIAYTFEQNTDHHRQKPQLN